MEVTIKGTAQDLRVSTITLQPKEGNDLYSVHCSSCGNWLNQQGGSVCKIYPYYEPSSDIPIISTCKTCGRKYTFQTATSYTSNKVRVILHPTENANFFYCTNHKQRILQYSPVEVFTLNDGRKHSLPFFADCTNAGCDKTYFFAELI